jgi:hypothetical protein
VGDTWIATAASAIEGTISSGHTHGLLPDFSALKGCSFDPSSVDRRVVDLYQHTSCWQRDVRADWSGVARPFGHVITSLWSQRLQQLSLPLTSSDTWLTMDSRVSHLHDGTGAFKSAVWIRTIDQTGDARYSGQYDIVTLPGSAQPSVRVSFPLPSGWLTVLLRPSAGRGGTFHLRSPLGPFGTDGAYLVLQRGDGTLSARRIPIAEQFDLRPGTDDQIEADHWLRLHSINVVHLEYRLESK